MTHRVVHLDVVDKAGRTYPLRGDVLRVADIGRAGGTMVNEGLARWTYEDPAGGDADRVRHLRVPAPARRRREACRPRRVGMAPRLEQRGAGGRARAPARRPRARPAPPLGRRVAGHQRVRPRDRRRRHAPAHPADGPRRRGPSRAGCGWRRALLAAAGGAGVPVPGVVAAAASGDELGAELAGGRAPGGRDDPAQAPARRRMGRRPPRPDRAGRARPGRHPHHRPGADRRACRRPTRWAIPCPSSMRWARSGPRSSSACAGWPPTARRPGRG